MSYPLFIITGMEFAAVKDAIELLEKANANLEPELLPAEVAQKLLQDYARAERLVAFGVAALARRLKDVSVVARATGTPLGKAKETVATGEVVGDSPELGEALRHGEISLEQAAEIAAAERSAPGSARELVAMAREEPFHVLRDRARKLKLEAEQRGNLAERQRAARSARSYRDEAGMVNIHLALEPHRGTPIVNRAEAEAGRLHRAARRNGRTEPFERHLADAYLSLMSGNGRCRTRRPDLVVLVSHEVVKRGWRDVRRGEVCKIPGVGPVSPEVAREIAQDAFLTGLFYDGKDLRQMRRWTRNTPVEVLLALELGEPPDFDGIMCVDCGNRFRTENDHLKPHVALGPASIDNLEPRCFSCHQVKTARDRKAGKLRAPDT
jgi:hypothetical protein